MKKILLFLPTSLFILFTACSWQQYFAVFNNTDKDIYIEYCIKRVNGGFPIFDQEPEFYKTNKKNNINWDAYLLQNTELLNDTTIRFTLAPSSVSIIGVLSNDNYTSYNQYFINGRSFNLEYIRIVNGNDTTLVVPDTFDNYFLNDNGVIAYKAE